MSYKKGLLVNILVSWCNYSFIINYYFEALVFVVVKSCIKNYPQGLLDLSYYLEYFNVCQNFKIVFIYVEFKTSIYRAILKQFN
jgi:hypothetical protein